MPSGDPLRNSGSFSGGSRRSSRFQRHKCALPELRTLLRTAGQSLAGHEPCGNLEDAGRAGVLAKSRRTHDPVEQLVEVVGHLLSAFARPDVQGLCRTLRLLQ
jgi:hypothetical protein